MQQKVFLSQNSVNICHHESHPSDYHTRLHRAKAPGPRAQSEEALWDRNNEPKEAS